MLPQPSPVQPAPHLLLVSIADEPQAEPLANALRQLGLRVIAVSTPEDVTALAPGALACLVLLRPAAIADATLQAVMALPARRIPIFAEAMILPMGAWASAPVLLGDDLHESAKQIAVFAAPPLLYPYPAPGMAAYPAPGYYPPFGYPAPAPGASKKPLIITLSIVGAVVVLLAACLGGLALTRAIRSSTRSPYAAAVPGPGCDHGGARWTTSSDTTVACQADGALVTRTAKLDFAGAIHFHPPGEVFAANYREAVDATLESGPHFSAVGLTAHSQQDGAGYLFYVEEKGRWVVNRQETSGALTRLAFGYLAQPSASYHLQIEVAGPIMTFAIDGAPVKIVGDSTFTLTTYLGLLAASGDEKTAVAARFANFSYTPLPDLSQLQQANAQATADAGAAPPSNAPYVTAAPGLGCDRGGAIWANPLNYYDDSTTTACSTTGLTLSQFYTNYAASERFYWLDGKFPTNYRVQARLDLSQLHAGCAGITTHSSTDGFYRFALCHDGAWFFEKYIQSSNNNTFPAQGKVARMAAINTLALTDSGATHTVALNGKTILTLNDGSFTATDHVSLVITDTAGGSGSVTFSNFVFTPLP